MYYNEHIMRFKWVRESHSVTSDSLRPHGLYPWNSPGQNTGVGSLYLLQGIFPNQGLNPGLMHYRPILYQLSQKGSPMRLKVPWNSNLQHLGPFWFQSVFVMYYSYVILLKVVLCSFPPVLVSVGYSKAWVGRFQEKWERITENWLDSTWEMAV